MNSSDEGARIRATDTPQLAVGRFTAAAQVAAEGWMADNSATADEAAIWTQFVPADVASKVNAALGSS